MDDNLVQRFIAQVNQMIDYRLKEMTKIESAVVESVNDNGTVNIFIPPNSTVYHNIQNQSIFQNLKPGDCVKVMKEKNDLSNMWIIGGFANNENTILEQKEEMKFLKVLRDEQQLQQQFISNNANFTIYSEVGTNPPVDDLQVYAGGGIGKTCYYYMMFNPNMASGDPPMPAVKGYPVGRSGILECTGVNDANSNNMCYYFEKYTAFNQDNATFQVYLRVGTQDLASNDPYNISWNSWMSQTT